MANHPTRRFADLADGDHSPLDAAVTARDRSTVDMVADAIRHRQTLLAYQPVVQTRAPDRIAFYEGLVRVPDATGRVIPARDFMSQVEDMELGRLLDCNALEIGLRTLARNSALRLSVNMSARSIGFRRWMQILERHLGRDPSLGERLILEISESSAMTVPELVIDFMDRLQGHGIAFALDDFGSGSFSVRHFRDFLFDAVKIDGQFVRGAHTDRDASAMLRALAAMARELDLMTIAESVEDARDAALLAEIGVDCMQGYLFGAPTVSPPWAKDAAARASA